MVRCPSTMTFPGTDSYFQILIIILRGRKTDRSWCLTLLVALFVHGREPKFCLWCWLSTNVAWVLITGTGQPYPLSALPQWFCFNGLQMWTGLIDEETEWRWHLWLVWETQEKLECLAVYQCMKTKSKLQHVFQDPCGRRSTYFSKLLNSCVAWTLEILKSLEKRKLPGKKFFPKYALWYVSVASVVSTQSIMCLHCK